MPVSYTHLKLMEKHSLKDYKAMLEAHGMLAFDNLCGQEDTEVTDVTYNSKEAVPGTLFICKGATFKKVYLEMALEAGAVGYVSDIDYEVDAPKLIVKNIREAMPKLVDFYLDVYKRQAVRDEEHPEAFAPGYDSGDHLHPSEQAYEVMAEAVPECLLR